MAAARLSSRVAKGNENTWDSSLYVSSIKKNGQRKKNREMTLLFFRKQCLHSACISMS